MKLKESETLELKKSTSELKEAIVSIVAILNKHGAGVLYFGVKNDGVAVGQSVSEKSIREISQSISENIEPKIYPKIREEEIGGKSCIVVSFEGAYAPYFAFGRAYMRVGDENRQLSAKELEKLFSQKNKESSKWESQVSERSIKDVGIKTVKEFVRKANEAGRLTYNFDKAKNVLHKLGLTKKEKLLKAAEVLFCKNNSLEVQMAIFAGVDKLTFLDIQQVKGNIFFVLNETELYIKNHIQWRVQFGKLEREEIPEIPVEAIREALVNSLCHRDYCQPESNKISIFKNRIEIYNPGDFPEGLTPNDFIKGQEESVLRNPKIAGTLYFSKDIEKFGSGLKRICQQCAVAKVKVEFSVRKTGFFVTFFRPDWESGGATVENTVENTVEKILALIQQNPAVTQRQLQEKTGLSRRGIEWNLQKLKQANLIRRIGPDKGGHWEIKKTQ